MTMMPVGDMIIIIFSAPVFTVLMSRVILKRKITFLSFSICILIVVGDVLVVRPPFLFSDDYKERSSSNFDASVFLHNVQSHGSKYFIGVGLVTLGAFTSGVAYSVSALFIQKGGTSNLLVLSNGLISFILSFAAMPVIENRIVVNPATLTLKSWLCIFSVVLLHTLSYFQTTKAIALTDRPTLITVFRSLEIPFSLITESIWWSHIPPTLSIVGALLILVCVTIMTYHDKISRWMIEKFNCLVSVK